MLFKKSHSLSNQAEMIIGKKRTDIRFFNKWLWGAGIFFLLFSSIAAYAQAPPLPARIGGTVTVDGIQLTQANADSYSFQVTRPDDSAFEPAAGTSGLNASDMYMINIPVYDEISQPGGAIPGETAKIRVFKNGTELGIVSPANGLFTIGDQGSIAQIDLICLDQQGQNDGVGLYSPATSTFYLKNALNGGAADHTFRYGPSGQGWLPFSGDWNGSGANGVGLYNASTGTFYLKNTLNGGSADHTFRFGPPGAGWKPISGDWNGNGIHGVGLYNPETGTFYLKNNLNAGSADYTFRYGPRGQGWSPFSGDWNGNGISGVGLYASSTGTLFLKNALTAGSADHTFRFGPSGAGWRPLAGDWNDTGNDGIGLFDPVTSTFFLKNIFSGGSADHTFRYGPSGASWIPLAGNWTGL